MDAISYQYNIKIHRTTSMPRRTVPRETLPFQMTPDLCRKHWLAKGEFQKLPREEQSSGQVMQSSSPSLQALSSKQSWQVEQPGLIGVNKRHRIWIERRMQLLCPAPKSIIVSLQSINQRGLSPERRSTNFICHVNHRYWKALGLHTYCLANKSGLYEDQVVGGAAKWAKCLAVQMKTKIVEPHDFISITPFLHLFKTECDTSRIHEGAGVCLLLFLIWKQPNTDLNSRVALREKFSCTHNKERTLRTYFDVVIHLLETTAMDNGIIVTDFGTVRFTQTPIKSLIAYAELLGTKGFRGDRVYDKNLLKRSLVQVIQESIFQAIHLFRASNKQATV